MTADDYVPTAALLRLRVTADGDPSVLPRLLGHLQNLNVTPRRVAAEFGISPLMHLQIDICGLAELIGSAAALLMREACWTLE